MKQHTMGIDCGTGGIRVGIFGIDGSVKIFVSEPLELDTPVLGAAEQQPEDWWKALCKASRRALTESGVPAESIIGLSCSTTVSTLVFADEEMKPLRPALMWCDVRASKQARRLAETKDEVLKYNGYGNVSAEWAAPKILWLKENEPNVWANSAFVCECVDYLGYKLTGQMAASINAVTIRWYYDNRNGGWPESFYERIGLDDLIQKVPPRVLKLGELVGTVTREAAAEMGLIADTPVGMGGCDAYLATLGLGVTEPGKMAMGMGSSHLQYVLLEDPVYDEGLFGSFPDAVIPGFYALEGGQASTGSIVEWFVRRYCGNIAMKAKAEGRSTMDLLNEEAKNLPVGSEGLVMLDYFQGNRTPWVDSDVRGMLYGLSLKHTPAHIYRTIIESICYGTEHIVSTFAKYVDRPKAIYASGGPTKSDLWVQTHADVSNVPVVIPECIESPCFGAAIIGAVTAGAYQTLQEASHAMVRIDRRVEPIEENHQQYQFYYKKYTELYPLVRDWMRDVTVHSA